jgi:hypothetical protein
VQFVPASLGLPGWWRICCILGLLHGSH